MSTIQSGNDDGNKELSTENEDRLSLLLKASQEHYNSGISLKNAAKKYGLGIKELKNFYENQYEHDMMNDDDSETEL